MLLLITITSSYLSFVFHYQRALHLPLLLPVINFLNAIYFMLLVTPYIKFFMWAVFVLSGIGLLLIYVLPQGSLPVGPPNGLPPLPSEAVQLTGIVKDFSSNRNGDVDQLLLETTDGVNQVNFPPHVARQVMQMAPKGTTIFVWVHTGPPHPPGPVNQGFGYQMEQLQAGDAVLPIADMPPPPPAIGKPVELNGTVDSLITGNRGEIVGLVVNGYRIALPPHLAHAIAPLLQQGKPILIKGYERSSSDGFVNASRQQLVKPYRMTLEGTDYLL